MAHFSTVLLVEQVQGAARRGSSSASGSRRATATAAGRLGAAAGEDRRLQGRRQDRHLRQGRLGLLDARRPHGARGEPRGPAGSSSPRTRTVPTTRCCRTSSRSCAARAGRGRVRRVRRSSGSRGRGAASTASPRREERVGEGEAWEVRATVRNDGTGTMPLEVAAANGERMDDEGKRDPRLPRRAERSPSARGRSRKRPSPAPSSPTASCVDPDVRVLQLERARATRRL